MLASVATIQVAIMKLREASFRIYKNTSYHYTKRIQVTIMNFYRTSDHSAHSASSRLLGVFSLYHVSNEIVVATSAMICLKRVRSPHRSSRYSADLTLDLTDSCISGFWKISIQSVVHYENRGRVLLCTSWTSFY